MQCTDWRSCKIHMQPATWAEERRGSCIPTTPTLVHSASTEEQCAGQSSEVCEFLNHTTCAGDFFSWELVQKGSALADKGLAIQDGKIRMLSARGPPQIPTNHEACPALTILGDYLGAENVQARNSVAGNVWQRKQRPKPFDLEPCSFAGVQRVGGVRPPLSGDSVSASHGRLRCVVDSSRVHR